VTDDGESLGVMDTRDAIQEARRRSLDLVEIAPNAQPPVAKIIDYGKFLYEQKKKAHEAKKKQVTVQVKEIKFRPAPMITITAIAWSTRGSGSGRRQGPGSDRRFAGVR
jgi:translation initiation factor IF-3